MFSVNNRDFEWEEGITVDILLKKLQEDVRIDYLIGKTTVVILNKKVVPSNQYDQKLINDGDLVQLISQIVGG